MGICGCTSKEIPIVPNKFTFDIENNEGGNIQIKVKHSDLSIKVNSTDVVKKTDCDLNSNKKPEINGPQSIIKIDNKTKSNITKNNNGNNDNLKVNNNKNNKLKIVENKKRSISNRELLDYNEIKENKKDSNPNNLKIKKYKI